MEHLSGTYAKRTYLLALAQALYLVCAVVSVSVAALVGEQLAPEPWMSTLPYGMQFAAIVVFAYPVSRVMGRIGRKPAFLFGACCAVAAGITAFLAVRHDSFVGLVAAHLILGIFIAHANYYRFAATDGVAPTLRARAVALVTAGGVLAGIIGPVLSAQTRSLSAAGEFAGSYLLFSLAGLLTLAILFLLPEAGGGTQRDTQAGSARIVETGPWFTDIPGFVRAVYAAGVGYLMMNLLMIQSTLALTAVEIEYGLVALAIQFHVVCMFLPSFFTGRLIERWGHRTVLALGYLLLTASGAVGSFGVTVTSVIAALVLLGVAWNFLYVGGSAYLTVCQRDAHQHRVQGLNDTMVSMLAAVGAFAAGALFETLGWSLTNLLVLPLSALGMVLLIARPKAVLEAS